MGVRGGSEQRQGLGDVKGARGTLECRFIDGVGEKMSDSSDQIRNARP